MPTAYSYTSSLGRFLARKEAQDAKRRLALAKRLTQAAKILTQQFPTITRVAVIGSFLSPAFSRVDSEVDIFVYGLPKEQYFDTFFLLERELQVPFDLICEEDISALASV